MMIFRRPITVIAVLILVATRVSAQAPASSPADRWTQFRGTPALVGISDAKLPAAPKLLWTYEAGDSIESSAAIVDGVLSRLLAELSALDSETRLARRYEKFRAMGRLGVDFVDEGG